MMKFLKFMALSGLLLVAQSCQSSTSKNNEQTAHAVPDPELAKYETAYFASGCFWCVEAIFESVKGVKEVVSGYSGGKEANPTYEQVSYGRTGHAESVEIYYDPKVVSFETLVQVFFGSHDPTTPNQQGPDKGRQYRSIAFYKNDAQKKTIEDYIRKLEREQVFKGPIVTQVVAFEKFWPAEDYHQNYEKLHPTNPYVRNVSIPRLRKFQKQYPELLKEEVLHQ